jgi:hypothetical protein
MFNIGSGRVLGAKRVMARALGMTVVGAWVLGCASSPDDPYGGWPGNFSRANLAPGRSVTCYSDPCTAQFMMPNAGGKTHVVWVNNLLAGEYPAAGQVVDLGAYYYYGSPYRFTIDGLDVPAAVLWVSGGTP